MLKAYAIALVLSTTPAAEQAQDGVKEQQDKNATVATAEALKPRGSIRTALKPRGSIRTALKPRGSIRT
ncbi:hypothetical protein [Neptunicella marina]|uniref:Uncharacterized protein n=1 Tax=Neptunicella marina TaxID=2125989 RepID=A0A8J6IVU6_9ALTE|nr:hypothetical protein [Neptunicella marina]MBC3766725.1 hypothetical protein [Neptunicella marina]